MYQPIPSEGEEPASLISCSDQRAGRQRATQVVLAIPFLFMGSLLLEAFFGIPGLGSMTFDAIQANDFATLRTMVYVGALLFIFGQVATDISYGFVDPRVRVE